MPMHHIEPDEQRNAEPRFLDRQALHLAHLLRTDQIEQIADGAGLDRLGRIARRSIGPVTAWPAAVMVS